jgi:sulfur carrier protein
VRITLNDEPREIPDGSTVAALLEQLGLADRPVAVEVNLDLVPRPQHAQRRLQADDRLEIVTLVGGG